MKTKELIELLMEQDPSGELDVVIGNEPIWIVTNLPAYYDGALQVVEFDREDECVPTKGKYVRDVKVRKISLRPYGIMDAILDYPELEVEYPDDMSADRYREKVEKMREEVRKIDRELDEEDNE